MNLPEGARGNECFVFDPRHSACGPDIIRGFRCCGLGSHQERITLRSFIPREARPNVPRTGAGQCGDDSTKNLV